MGMPAIFEVPIVGVTFQPQYPKSITSLTEDSMVHIVRDKKNPVDANAIKVQHADGTVLGYIPAAVAKKLTVELEKGTNYTATIRVLVNVDHANKPGAILKLKKN